MSHHFISGRHVGHEADLAVSTSSIIVYDIIGTYFRPLNERQTVFSFHASICVLSVWLGAWSCILHVANIDLGWLFYVQGVMLTPAVFPIGATVCWAKMSKWSALFGTLIGQTCGMLGWMLGCYKVYGEINIRNLALPYSAISGSA
jgi:Na+/proline symporter